jgi:hypothetical protein
MHALLPHCWERRSNGFAGCALISRLPPGIAIISGPVTPLFGALAGPFRPLAEMLLSGVKALGYNSFCALASAATGRPRASHLGRESMARLNKVAIK